MKDIFKIILIALFALFATTIVPIVFYKHSVEEQKEIIKKTVEDYYSTKNDSIFETQQKYIDN